MTQICQFYIFQVPISSQFQIILFPAIPDFKWSHSKSSLWQNIYKLLTTTTGNQVWQPTENHWSSCVVLWRIPEMVYHLTSDVNRHAIAAHERLQGGYIIFTNKQEILHFALPKIMMRNRNTSTICTFCGCSDTACTWADHVQMVPNVVGRRHWQFYQCYSITHRGRVTHICVSTLTIIGSDNGLLPGRHQAII